MNDEAFLGYCLVHADTDLALFSATHCRRLFELAQEPFPEPALPETAFRSMTSDTVRPLVARARARKAGAA